MTARIPHPVMIIPGALEALHALGATAEEQGVPRQTIELVRLRASQINGCEVCVGGHCIILRRAGETEDRMDEVANWRQSQKFDAAERAALGLTEEATRIADRPDAVPDDVWDEAARHYDERGLSALLIAIASSTVYNQLNVSVRLPAGSWVPE